MPSGRHDGPDFWQHLSLKNDIVLHSAAKFLEYDLAKNMGLQSTIA